MPEVRKALWDCGYVLVIIGGGIAGFVKVKDTHLHKKLKSEYRIKESALMLEKLTKDPKKVPAPDRGEMMSLLAESEKAVKLDANTTLKSVWVTNCLGGSEDYLVNDKIFALVGDNMIQFINEMRAKPPPKNIKEVIRSIIPPKVIKRGKNTEEIWIAWWRRNRRRRRRRGGWGRGINRRQATSSSSHWRHLNRSGDRKRNSRM